MSMSEPSEGPVSVQSLYTSFPECVGGVLPDLLLICITAVVVSVTGKCGKARTSESG